MKDGVRHNDMTTVRNAAVHARSDAGFTTFLLDHIMSAERQREGRQRARGDCEAQSQSRHSDGEENLRTYTITQTGGSSSTSSFVKYGKRVQ